jgi:hypothetical protein
VTFVVSNIARCEQNECLRRQRGTLVTGVAGSVVTPPTLGPGHAHASGFDLHAGLMTRAGQRDRLERLYRYALRPPTASEEFRRRST